MPLRTSSPPVPIETQTGNAVEGSPSIDHVDPTQGAIWGSWRIISRRASQLKSKHSAASLAAHIAALAGGVKVLQGRVSLEEYSAVLQYLTHATGD